MIRLQQVEGWHLSLSLSLSPNTSPSHGFILVLFLSRFVLSYFTPPLLFTRENSYKKKYGWVGGLWIYILLNALTLLCRMYLLHVRNAEFSSCLEGRVSSVDIPRHREMNICKFHSHSVNGTGKKKKKSNIFLLGRIFQRRWG